MSKVLIVHTGWYRESIEKMNQISIEVLEKKYTFDKVEAPGSIELAALAKNKILKNKYIGVIFNGIVIRGETSHYDLISNETFRSIGLLAENFYDIAIINNVICVENKNQLKERLDKNTKNNTKALMLLIDEKSC
tara:strand:+ start:2856 stop:3260 length:405 start_codon:yes stop_codon:yes gene_type:complete